MLDRYLYGNALLLATLPFEGAEGMARMNEQVFLPQLDVADHPHLAEAVHVLADAGQDPTDEFAVGLEVVLDAVAAFREG